MLLQTGVSGDIEKRAVVVVAVETAVIVNEGVFKSCCDIQVEPLHLQSVSIWENHDANRPPVRKVLHHAFMHPVVDSGSASGLISIHPIPECLPGMADVSHFRFEGDVIFLVGGMKYDGIKDVCRCLEFVDRD
jgi:hypothetical protein